MAFIKLNTHVITCISRHKCLVWDHAFSEVCKLVFMLLKRGVVRGFV